MDEFDLLFSGPVTPPKETDPKIIQAGLNRLKKVTKVYRLEGPDGYGPYHERDWQKSSHTPANGRPTPNMDDGFRMAFQDEEVVRRGWFDEMQKSSGKNVLFGFSSFRQLHRWFHNHEEIKELFKRGYTIRVYKNVEAYDSGKQCFFFTKHFKP